MAKHIRIIHATLAAIASAVQVNAGLIGLQNAVASYSQRDFGVDQAIDNIIDSTYPYWNGWAVDPKESSLQSAVFQTVNAVNFKDLGGQVEFMLIQDFNNDGEDYHQIGKFQLAYTTASRVDLDSTWIVVDASSYQAYSRDGIPSSTILTKQLDNSLLATGANHRGYYVIDAPLTETAVTGFRIDVLAGREPSNGNFVLTEFLVSDETIPIPIHALDSYSWPVPEPSTYFAGFSALAMLGLFGCRNRM